MRSAWIVSVMAVGALVACKRSADEPHETPKPAAPAVDLLGLAPGPLPVLAPLAELPPPAPGYFRVAYYDLDVKVADATHAERSGRTAITFDHGCLLGVNARLGEAALQVGTLAVNCFGTGRDQADRIRTECDTPCKTLVAVPGSTAVEPYPREPPVIEVGSTPHFGDRIASGAYVWSDGTVQFFGPTCTRWRGRRGTLPRERVAAILVTLERTDALVYPIRDSGPCEDGTVAWLDARPHGSGVTLHANACTRDGSPVPRPVAIATAALGPNPCNTPPRPQPPLAKAAPPELVPVAAAAPFPSAAPAIDYRSGGGISGSERESVAVWLDGTVRYIGDACKRPRRGKLRPERVAALLAALDQRAMLDSGVTMDDQTACCDCRYSSLELRLGDKHARLIAPGCGYSATYGYTDADALVMEAVGANPCVPPPD